jgi:hypothetical protein
LSTRDRLSIMGGFARQPYRHETWRPETSAIIYPDNFDGVPPPFGRVSKAYDAPLSDDGHDGHVQNFEEMVIHSWKDALVRTRWARLVDVYLARFRAALVRARWARLVGAFVMGRALPPRRAVDARADALDRYLARSEAELDEASDVLRGVLTSTYDRSYDERGEFFSSSEESSEEEQTAEEDSEEDELSASSDEFERHDEEDAYDDALDKNYGRFVRRRVRWTAVLAADAERVAAASATLKVHGTALRLAPPAPTLRGEAAASIALLARRQESFAAARGAPPALADDDDDSSSDDDDDDDSSWEEESPAESSDDGLAEGAVADYDDDCGALPPQRFDTTAVSASASFREHAAHVFARLEKLDHALDALELAADDDDDVDSFLVLPPILRGESIYNLAPVAAAGVEPTVVSHSRGAEHDGDDDDVWTSSDDASDTSDDDCELGLEDDSDDAPTTATAFRAEAKALFQRIALLGCVFFRSLVTDGLLIGVA